MNRYHILIFSCILLLCVTSLNARGSKEKETVPVSDAATQENFIITFSEPTEPLPVGVVREVQVTGRIRLVGPSLFTDLVITSSDSEWYIAQEEREKLSNYQQQTVTVAGDEIISELRFANGMFAGYRRLLSNIKIISVQ